MLCPASPRFDGPKKVCEVRHELSVWLQEYFCIAFRVITHFVEVFILLKGAAVFLTHLWLSFLITWHWNRQKKKKKTYHEVPLKHDDCVENYCVYVVYACVLYTSLLVCFRTRLPFTRRAPLPSFPPILPVCYLVAVHPKSLPSSPRYTSTTVFKKKMLVLYVSLYFRKPLL